MPMVIITPMLIGAAVGAVAAAVTGGNILKGALFGAIGGAIGGAFSGMAGSAATSTVAGATEGAVAGGADAAIGAATSATAEVLPTAASAATDAFSVTTMGNPSAFTQAPTGMVGAEPASAAAAPAGASTGLAPAVNSTGIAPASSNTGIGGFDESFRTGYSDGGTAGGSGLLPSSGSSGSFLDNLLSKGSSMLNNRFVTDTAGRIISGYAQGQQQQKMMDWKAQQEQLARNNARFASTGSRYNTGGMIGAPATYPTR